MTLEQWQSINSCLNGLADIISHRGWQQPHPAVRAIPVKAAPKQDPSLLPPPPPPLTPKNWKQEILECRRCPLREKYHLQPVVDCRAETPDLLVVVGPVTAEANSQHQPLPPEQFDYLLRWLKAIGAENRYLLTNIVKCLPPAGRNPFASELLSCLHHLRQQRQLFPFRAVLALGGIAARALSLSQLPLPQLRERRLSHAGLPLVATYEPALVLRHPEQLRRPVWQDLQRLANLLG